MMFRLRLLSLAIATLLAAGAAHAELLHNSGFETGDTTSWTTFGYNWRIGTDPDARTGTYGLLVDDHLELDVGNWHGVFQNVPVVPRLAYSAGVFIRAVNVKRSLAFLEIQWLDAYGQTIHQVRSPSVTRDQPFRLVEIKNVKAPVGAVTASIRGIFFMPGAPGNDDGIFVFDDFTMKTGR
jgi:hypothetical protein